MRSNPIRTPNSIAEDNMHTPTADPYYIADDNS